MLGDRGTPSEPRNTLLSRRLSDTVSELVTVSRRLITVDSRPGCACVAFPSSRMKGEALSSHMKVAAPPGALTSLDLVALRLYRRSLASEEDRVSYWRRLLHARIDVLSAQARSETSLTFEQLVRALGDTGTGHSRQALARIAASEPLPELPELERLWMLDVDPLDEAGIADALVRLRAAEAQLTEYRRALHARIDEAGEHLIARYREDPSAALLLIPMH